MPVDLIHHAVMFYTEEQHTYMIHNILVVIVLGHAAEGPTPPTGPGVAPYLVANHGPLECVYYNLIDEIHVGVSARSRRRIREVSSAPLAVPWYHLRQIS